MVPVDTAAAVAAVLTATGWTLFGLGLALSWPDWVLLAGLLTGPAVGLLAVLALIFWSSPTD